MPTNRRRFIAGVAVGLAAAGMAHVARAQETRAIATSAGSYDIPADPRRVVAIDFRLDVEPALALGLPIAGYGV